jgi:hypothetical protein
MAMIMGADERKQLRYLGFDFEPCLTIVPHCEGTDICARDPSEGRIEGKTGMR